MGMCAALLNKEDNNANTCLHLAVRFSHVQVTIVNVDFVDFWWLVVISFSSFHQAAKVCLKYGASTGAVNVSIVDVDLDNLNDGYIAA